MATVPNLKTPFSSKAEVKIGGRISLRVDVCGLFGHVWNWQDKVPQEFSGSWTSMNGQLVSGNHRFEAPFRHGYAWACEREDCGAWLAVHQIDSSRHIPVARQRVTLFGSHGSYYFDHNSPFCAAT